MERLWSGAEAAYRAQILAAVPRDPTARLLDVGCDDGAWTDIVRREIGIPPDSVAGIEVVDSRADAARARGFDVRTADLDGEWPFDEGSFDVVHANQVIEHVERLHHFVAEIRRVLVPGGLALVWTENLASWHNVGALALGYQPFSATNISALRPVGNPLALHVGEPNPKESWQHVHVLALTALVDLFRAHGFAVTGTWGSGYHPFAGRAAAGLAALDKRHAHFVGVAARR
jgi:SAM-dependent methyltransferase